MSKVLINTFNEDNPTIFDYSENALQDIAFSATHVADTEGFYLDFNGTTNSYQFLGGVNGVSFTNTATIYIRFWLDANTGTDFIYSRENWGNVTYDGTDIVFEMDDGLSQSTCTLTAPGTSQWIRIACVYDSTPGTGATLHMMDDTDTLTTDTDVNTITALNDEDIFFGAKNILGIGLSDYFDGRISVTAIANTADSLDTIMAWFDNPQGQRLNRVNIGFELGDLLRNFNGPLTSKVVVTFKATDYILFYMMNDEIVPEVWNWSRVGNRGIDTTRQHALVFLNLNPPAFAIYDGVDKHSDLDTTVKMVGVMDKNGFRRKGNEVFLTALTTILSADRWVMCDSSGGGFTVNHPSSLGLWEEHTFKDANGSANAGGNLIIISGNGTNIDGAAATSIKNSYGSVTTVYNGTELSIVTQQS